MGGPGKAPVLHPVDGKLMSAREIAEMLGISHAALVCRRQRLGCSYQQLVIWWREGLLQRDQHDRYARHMIDGQWVTTEDICRELGLSRSWINNWRCRQFRETGRRPTLEETREHFRAYKGVHPGRMPRTYWVNGRQMTVAQAADKYGVTECSLRNLMCKKKMSLNSAVKRSLEEKQKRAEREILRTLGF